MDRVDKLRCLLPKPKKQKKTTHTTDDLVTKSEPTPTVNDLTQKNPAPQTQPNSTTLGETTKYKAKAYENHFQPDWDSESIKKQADQLVKMDIVLTGIGQVRCFANEQNPLPDIDHASADDDQAWMVPCGVLPPLRSRWLEHTGIVTKSSIKRNCHLPQPMPRAARQLFSLICGYRDLLHASAALDDYIEGGLLAAIALHTAQHLLLSTRCRLRHSKKGSEVPDQGFTRPTVLVVLPFRSHAYNFVQSFLSLLPASFEQVDNRSRFESEFNEEHDAIAIPAAKPEDYRKLFEGNSDDCFRIGIRLSRNSVKLFSSFYSSDLIIASPLGLRLGLGVEGEKEVDTDWLSSIEVLISLYTDVFRMQNWAHFSRLFELINTIPHETRDTDFSRVRPYVLDGMAGSLRQTIMLAAHAEPEMRALMLRRCSNCAGRAETLHTYRGILASVPSGMQQLFLRFDASNPETVADERLAYFRSSLLPRLIRSLNTGSGSQPILYVPSYFDFVRVRTLFADEAIPFAAVSEYTESTEIARIRSALRKGVLGAILLYTERAHFFRRHLLRGAHHLACYGLPSYEHYYAELAQMLDQSSRPTCATIFCKLDLQPLRRLVGDVRAAQMLEGKDKMFAFSS